jgi:hypothetical protein
MTLVPTPSVFAQKVADIALDQYDRFHQFDENDSPLKNQVKKYWQSIGEAYPGISVPWGTLFICYCVKKAGATSSEFKYAVAYSIFTNDAINNPRAYEGVDVASEAVRTGDILVMNTNNQSYDFQYAKNNSSFLSRAAIVAERSNDAQGKLAVLVQGNSDDSIRKFQIRLNTDGTVKQDDNSSFICLLKCRK